MQDGASPDRDAYLAGLKRFFEEQIRFNGFLGMRVLALEDGRSTLCVPFKDDLVGDPFRPALHGGVVSSLADTAGGIAAFTRVRPGDRLATVDLRVDYLRPAALEDLYAEGRVLRIGNRVAVCDIVVHQGEADRPVAIGRGVYNVHQVGAKSG